MRHPHRASKANMTQETHTNMAWQAGGTTGDQGTLNGTGCWANWIGTQAFRPRNYSFIYFKCSHAYTIYRVTFSSSTPWPRGYKPKFPTFSNAFLARSHRNPKEWTTATKTQNIEIQFKHPELGPPTHSAWTRLSPLYFPLISFLQIVFWASTMGYIMPCSPHCQYLCLVTFSLIPFRTKHHGNL